MECKTEEFIFEETELINTTNSYTKDRLPIPTLVVDGEVCLVPTFSLARLGEMVYVVSGRTFQGDLVADPPLEYLQEHINACVRCEENEGKTSCMVAVCRLKSDPYRVGVVAGATIRKPTKDEFEKLCRKVK